ncbi:bifunctional oligoribonuclease/PAP phosphatase NrnA [Paenibacillus sp.]|uniref:DHH family phosphoesterase n=1 Tax=Paenibacillus sp. TaxID=58172 RepID=UPI002D713C4C|nr:bifunctional oligoribonuclease/PAP phosphatase NrnA [Paenibacillus sp.]HZG57324.1 bifunctional oligoribonuclease/PAP phosphatase NrnA [Paenibacillus sp.]
MSEASRQEAYEDALRRAAAFLRENDDFLVVSHLSPDGDAIGSTGAIGFLLRALGKTYTLANEGRTPDKYAGLLGDQSIVDFGKAPLLRRFEAVIAVDCADFARIGAVHTVFAEGRKLLNIDHHPTNDDYGTHNLVKPSAAATVEIIFELAETLGVPWSKPLATCIYAGLLTDTGGFRYSNTTPQVLSIAERMLRLGVDGAGLAERLLETMSYPQVLLLKAALSSLQFTPDRRVGWVSVSRETLAGVGAADEDTEGLVNLPRNVDGVEVGILFKEKTDGIVKVSLRSSGRVDVAALAKTFGGGGHVRAAGCTINGTLDEAIRRVVEAVNEKL